MKASDKPQFMELITDVLAFYKQDVSDFAITVWWQASQNFELEQVRKALTSHAMDPEKGQFPPKPADLVRMLQGTHTDRALLAWNKAYKAISQVGAYQTLDLGDPIAHAAIQTLGGWPKFCQSQVDELPFLQKRFCDFYRTYTTRGVEDAPTRLSGISATENGARGFIESNVQPLLLRN
jgi:hypothetical protein